MMNLQLGQGSVRSDTAAEAPVLWPPDVNRSDSLEKSLLGRIESRQRRGCQRMG